MVKAYSGVLSLAANLNLLLTKGASVIAEGRYALGVMPNSPYRLPLPSFSFGASSQLTRHTTLSLMTLVDGSGVSFIPT